MSPPFSCDLDSQFVMKRLHRDLRAFSGFDTSHSPIAASCRSMLHAGYADAHALRSASEMPDQPASRAHAISHAPASSSFFFFSTEVEDEDEDPPSPLCSRFTGGLSPPLATRLGLPPLLPSMTACCRFFSSRSMRLE